MWNSQRRVGSKRRLECVLLLAGLELVAGLASAAVTPTRRQRAVAAYEKAERLHATLETRAESSRTKDDYKKVIDAYFEVYRQDPAYGKSPVALTAVAELDREMGHTFSSDSYYLEAIKSYHFLADQYPRIRITREALFTIGDVYLTDLEDPDEARRAYQKFIAMFPKSDDVPKAKQKLKEIERQMAAKSKPEAPAAAPVALAAEQTSEDRRPGLRQVTAVRRWVGPNYLRIVIGVDGEAKFESVRLSNPDRIVIDLQNARLSPELGARTFPVEDGFLRQIRVAQFSPDVARVVLDVVKIESYSIFSLPNPFRLVIDVQGTAPTQLARSSKPVPAPNAEGRDSGKSRSPVTPSPVITTHAGVVTGSSPASSGSVKTTTVAESSTPAEPKAQIATVAPKASKPGKLSKEKPTEATVDTEAEVVPAIQPAAPTESGSTTLTRALGLKIGRIVIDPGHGGHDTGTIGPTGLEEKNVVLDVALKLRKLLEENTGCEVIMTRTTDKFVPLEERTAIANEKAADLFISIHANASRDETARGIETYYLNFTSSPDALDVAARENASSQEAVHQLQDLIKKIAMTEKIEESEDFARQVQREVYTRVTKVSGAQRDRGVKKAPFVVLIGANMPSILAEISFLTNPRDERLLRRSDYREKIAYALYEGILGYLKTLGEVRTAQRVASDQTSAATRPDF